MMTDDNVRTTMRDGVRDYYEEHALSDDAVRRLASLPRPRHRPGRSRTWTILGAVAATLTLVALGLGLGGSDLFTRTVTADEVAPTPRLVAVQIHADWCARSPEVAPVFAELLTQYGNQPVLFVTFDITDDARREQARLLGANLGISRAFDAPFESGMIKLIDRERGTVLAAITGRAQADELNVQIAEALDGLETKRSRERSLDGGGA